MFKIQFVGDKLILYHIYIYAIFLIRITGKIIHNKTRNILKKVKRLHFNFILAVTTFLFYYNFQALWKSTQIF